MRYSKGHKEETHQHILRNASMRFRRDGLESVGIASLMADSGLTHGGFYAHFKSKEDVFRQSVVTALADTYERLAGAAERAEPRKALDAIVNAYLSTTHRDHPEWGCAGAALAPEIARQSVETKENFAESYQRIVALLEKHLPKGGSPATRRQRAVAVFAGMMGALQLSRASTDKAVADEILTGAKAAALAAARATWNQPVAAEEEDASDVFA